MVEIGVRNGVMASHDKGRNKEAQVDNIPRLADKVLPTRCSYCLRSQRAFIFVSKQVTENAISAQFAQPCGIRGKAATDSDGKRPPNPIKAATRSDRRRPPC